MNQTDLIQNVLSLFHSKYADTPKFITYAPGRANLIGEHTDYNDGFVLPIAINRGTAIAAKGSEDKKLRIFSENLNSFVEVSLDSLHPMKENSWANYVTGVAFFLQQSGARLEGANLCIYGNIPHEAGLSSSASLEIATAYIFQALNSLHYEDLELVKLCQKAENEFVGVQCGIMDQFVCRFAKANHAVFLDCRSLSYEYLQISEDVQLIVCDTGVRRALARSEYNRRREECTRGVKTLAAILPGIRALRDVSLSQFQQHEHLLDPIVRKRCLHVISEIDRVKQAVNADTMSEFGTLMCESHMSLKNYYEVSSPELDAVVDICASVQGVYGARMTGAGFGGSAICLAKKENADDVVTKLRNEYPKQTGREPLILVSPPEDGVKVIKV